MRSRTRNRLQSLGAVFGTVAAVYGVSRLIAPASPPKPAAVTTRYAAEAPPIVPRVDPAPTPAPARPIVDSSGFHAAIEAGDLERSKKSWSDGLSLAGTLGDAAETGKVELVTWLLDRGADVHEDEALGTAPLLRADAHSAVVSVLLGRGANEPSLSTAVTMGKLNAMKRLVASRANVDDDDLMTAIGSDDVALRDKMLDVLLAAPGAKTAAAEALGRQGFPADAKIVRRLAGTGAKIPLFEAIERGDAPLALAMLEAGASATQTKADGKTTLIAALDDDWAGADDKLAVVRALLARGADPNRTDLGGDMPLVKAASSDDVRIVALLLDHGARINHGLAERDGSSTALEIAEVAANTKITRLLLQRGAKRRPVPKAIDD